MDENAAFQAGKYLENLVVDVAAGLADVRGIKKEDIASTKLTEKIDRNVLDTGTNDLNALVVGRTQKLIKPLSVRFDEGATGFQADRPIQDIQQNSARKSRPDLYDARGTQMPHHASLYDSIANAIHLIVAIVTVFICRLLGEIQSIPIPD